MAIFLIRHAETPGNAARHLALPAGQEAPERWDDTSLTIVEGPGPWRVRLLNCTAHLDGLASDADSGAV